MNNVKLNTLEEWGYSFKGLSAINSLIRELEGKAVLESSVEFIQKRNHASNLIFELFGQESYLFYVRRKGIGRETGEEIWELTLATIQENFSLPARLQMLEKTMCLRAVVQQNGYGGLQILSALFLNPDSGYTDGYAVPLYLRLLPNYKHGINIPQTALQRMSTMPVCGDYIPTEEQLKVWEVFLQIEEKIARARQFCVPYLAHNYGSNTRQITFNIDVAIATLDGASENSLDEEDFWERVRRINNEEIKLFETAPIGKNLRRGRQIGTIAKFDSNSYSISIRLERELADYMAAGHYLLPATGFLFFEDAGNISQVKRKRKALEDLKEGRCQNPFLGNFFFESSQARPVIKTIELQLEDLLLSSANSSQKAAVEMVLAAQDLALIQGPPGTGKTTVIAEICYQVAVRGGRTLIASQANLAVDNALSRLIHNPVIRALRKGNAEKVAEEGQPFLEDRVIDTWLKNTANDCEKNLNQRLYNIEILGQLLRQFTQFKAYLKAEDGFNQKYNLLQTSKENLELSCQTERNKYNEITEQLEEIISLKTSLDNILNQAPLVNWQDPTLVNLWTNLLPYTSTDSSVRDFVANVGLAVDIVCELGIKQPELSLFGVAAWLHNDIIIKITEVRNALSYATHTSIAMTEAESIAQNNNENLNSLSHFVSNHQQSLFIQTSLQEKIKNLQNRTVQINLAKNDINIWSSMADTNINNILNRCFQNRQDFTVDLIQLPSSLLTLSTQIQRITWQQDLNRYQIKINRLIEKYRQWDRLSIHIVNLKSLLLQVRKLQDKYSINQIDISQVTFNKTLDPVSFIIELEKQLQASIDDINKPLGVWSRIVEWILKTSIQCKNLKSLATILRRYSRRYNAVVTSEAIKIQTEIIEKMFRLINNELAVSQMTTELIESVVNNANTWLKELQIETEREQKQTEQKLQEQIKISANYQQQISDIQVKLEISNNEAEFKFKRAIALFQELIKIPQLPQKIRAISQQYLLKTSAILTEIPKFSAKIQLEENRINHLEKLILSFDIFVIITNIKNHIASHILTLKSTSITYKNQLNQLENQFREIIFQLQQELEYISNQRNWWKSIWQTIPNNLKPEIPDNDLLNLEFLHSIENQFYSWKQQLQTEETYLNHYQYFIQDWITKLRQPSERDSNDLKRIYLDNANVVGITCVQAANYDFSKEFKYFDIVIIDEVSKCTPPELLIPALKGKKLVLVGDHRQLPPMLNTDTIVEVAEEIGSTTKELQFLEESLFKNQFETADTSIKKMLNTQYRMHPDIMGAINQFYDDQLQCGILEPDSNRAHSLAGEIIKPKHHLIWVKIPQGKQFQEQSQGTSFFNSKEIDVIKSICQQFENIWSTKVANGEPRKEIAIITFYGTQLRKIDEQIKSQIFPSLQITTGTVDRFQGMERPIVIVSMVRNNSQGNVGFAKKPERVNVAFSRAQELLIIVGCHSLFTQQHGKIGSMYSNVSNIVRLNGGLIDVSHFIH